MSSFRKRTLVTVLVCLALLAAGCRGADTGASSKGGIKTDVGVTSAACPHAVNSDHGCIYLGLIADLTQGPFAALIASSADAQKAFWKKVNEDGGIGGYDIDVTTYIRDNKYSPQVHSQVYQEIKGKVLALAQTQGSPTTAAIIDDMKANKVVGAPTSLASRWSFQDVIIESGANYCFETMNDVDYAVERFGAKSVLALHYAGDYGNDAAAGARIAAEKNGLKFTDVETTPGQDNQAGGIDAIVSGKPDLVILSTAPTDSGVIVGEAVARHYGGNFIGNSPSWNPSLLQGPAAAALEAHYLTSQPWEAFAGQSPGHEAMRAALGSVKPNEGYTAGWVPSYPLKAVLEKAAANKDLTRAGVLRAVRQVSSVDYEGLLPAGAGDFKDDPNKGALRQSLILKPDRTTSSGLAKVRDFTAGPTAKDYMFTKPCADLFP